MTSASLAGDFRSNDSERRLDGLVAEHFDFVWRVARRLGASAADADDVVQEVFLVAARRLSAIAAERERAFLIGVVMRVLSSERRRVRRRREEPEALTDQLVAAAGDPLQSLELSQARLLLAEVLADLPLDLRAVLVLYELEQLSVGEIAELLATPRGTVSWRLKNARESFVAAARRLRAKLDHPKRSS